MMMEERGVRLSVEQLDFAVDRADILHQVELEIQDGEFVGLIGPNGCGKTTLLKNIYRVYQPTKGAVYLDGQNLREMDAKSVARKMAVLGQERGSGFDFPVIEMVLMGRYAHKKFLEPNREEDYAICRQALAWVGLLEFEERSFLSLSGGEKQRVLLAAVLAQQSGIILLDEPTNHLDIGYQLMAMDLIRDIPNVTVFASLHDMNIAARYCDRILAMKEGRIIASGRPDEVLTGELIRDLFQVEVRVDRDPDNGKPNIVFVRACFS